MIVWHSILPSVSILAHPERWALRLWTKKGRWLSTFQSSPTPKGGRYACTLASISLLNRFNPRPPRKVGATAGTDLHESYFICFNPRPPRKVGATFG